MEPLIAGKLEGLDKQGKKGNEKPSDPQKNGMNGHINPTAVIEMDRQEQHSTVPPSVATASAELQSKPIPVPELGKHIQHLTHTNGFLDEFTSVPTGELKATSDAKRPSIMQKNRFNNIFPYNETRVKLKILHDSDDEDYVNASYVRGYGSVGPFIAAQGPNDNTVNDFIRMTWETGSTIVVMLTNLEEKNRRKCSQYWPDEGFQMYDDIKVQLESVKRTLHYVVRTLKFTVNTRAGEQSRYVKQYHFITWPDEDVPQTATDVITFHDVIMKDKKEDSGPIIIHCSAGVGRTGTLIALDSLMEQAKLEGVVDVLRFVHQMRTDRLNMVQSLAQYRFIYHLLIEKLLCKHVSIPLEQFPFVLPIIQHPEEDDPKSVIEHQFDVLDVFKRKKGDIEEATSEGNADKNRDSSYLPEDDFRPALARQPSRNTEYVSAVFAPSFKDSFGFFTTTMPMANTIVEFWRLVLDYNIATIVMLNPQDKEPHYWPQGEEDEMTFDIVKIIRMSQEETDDVIETTLQVSYQSSNSRALSVKHFQHKDTSADTGLSERAMLDLYQHAIKWRNDCQFNRVLVHCMTGTKESGKFLALEHIAMKVDIETEVDVFNAVKKIRVSRPDFVATLDQYQYLYRVADMYHQHLQRMEEDGEDGYYVNVRHSRASSRSLDSVKEEEEPEEAEEEPEAAEEKPEAVEEEPPKEEEPISTQNTNEEPISDSENNNKVSEEKDNSGVDEEGVSTHHLVIDVE